MSSRARTLAVVVPSPAESFALPATSLMSWAPAFWTGSVSSMARAMVTPSLMTWMDDGDRRGGREAEVREPISE